MELDKYTQQDQELEQQWEKVDQVILGYVDGFNSQSQPLVSFIYRGTKHRFAALSSGAALPEQGRQVALSFVAGQLSQPIILGTVYSPLAHMLDNMQIAEDDTEGSTEPPLLEQPVKVDGKRVCIEGAEQVELKCGDASITLTKSGKILIRGKYLLNRASGVNRIVGGSVQVN